MTVNIQHKGEYWKKGYHNCRKFKDHKYTVMNIRSNVCLIVIAYYFE